MSAFRLFGAVVVLSTAIATPGAAQQVISEPGYCAQFYPYANCQNKGPGNPYTSSYYQRGPVQGDGMWWPGDQTVGVATNRPRAYRAEPPSRRAQ